MKNLLVSLAALATFPLAANAQTCGGGFQDWLNGVKAEAVEMGYAPALVDKFLANVAQDPATLKADRSQGVFKMEFVDFSRRIISQNRLDNGRHYAKKYASLFKTAEQKYGVSPGVLLAFWALETDFGGYQGDFNTLNSLLTLSHDCRRPDLFRPQIFAALELYKHGDFDPRKTTGAWAGEIGMVQMLPADILTNGVDGDGDGHVSLKTSVPDAILSGAKMLKHLGWRAGEPWLQEITAPSDLDWSQTGLEVKKTAAEWQAMGVKARQGTLAQGMPASVILPQGRQGPAFLAYPNFDVYFEWNQSFVYVTSAAYFATRLMGAPIFDAGNPETGLGPEQMKSLQRKLQTRGYDVGDVDGILGAKTRAAVQAEQQRLELPADAWPTPALLSKL
jgi:lytic murein transglycosylase